MMYRGLGRAIIPTHQWPPAWASAWGDDRYGLWADWSLGAVEQRFRWIEPGSFLMGSPVNEYGRYRDEGPQHKIVVTEGYWLADTACTQALWLAVMGRNPSNFQGDELRPVEQVSWDDVVEQFLPELQVLLPPQFMATLPTEVQWEYACRAGTKTPFSWGEKIYREIVNHDSSWFSDQEERDPKQTVSVKAMPANEWGLYQMHGNVWEWCLDEMRDYAVGKESESADVAESERRVLRGGAWNTLANRSRSAYRYSQDRGLRLDTFGFRLVFTLKPA